MKLLFKQRFFSWLDSYDVYNENNEIVYRVEGKLSFGHELHILNDQHEKIGIIKERIMTFLPCFVMYVNNQEIGMIQKEFSFFRPRYHLSCNDWTIEGDIFEFNYEVRDHNVRIMSVEKAIFNFTDTYVLDIPDEQNQLVCLMIILAIDAAKCSNGK